MNRVEWTPDDLVYSRQLDGDHRKLFDRLEQVRQTLEPSGPSSRLGFHLWRLSKDLSIHFSSEERLMREYRYPAMQWHQRQHAAGRNKMGRLLVTLRTGAADGRAGALDDLAQWLKDHVHLADRMFAAHLRNQERGRLAS
jgi:hemerythrin